MSDEAGSPGDGGLKLGPVTLPTAQAGVAAGKVKDAAVKGVRQAQAGVGGLLARVRHRNGATPRRDRRPDGSLVSLSPVVSRPPEAGGPLHVVVAPIIGARDAIRERWDDAMREARLAARDKEAELRAQYERQVQHDPRLHAEQHENRDKN